MEATIGFRSVVFGHIQTLDDQTDATNRQSLLAFEYDPVSPFPNISDLERPPRDQAPSVIF